MKTKRIILNGFWTSIDSIGTALFLIVVGSPHLMGLAFPPPAVETTVPVQGGQVTDTLDIFFSLPMQSDFGGAIEFSAGEWSSSTPGFFIQLVCTATVPPPAGALTVTLNPDGTGFKSEGFLGITEGENLPRTTLTFTATGGEPGNGIGSRHAYI